MTVRVGLLLRLALGAAFAAFAGAGADDRIVSNVDANSFTTVWVDPDNASRYGTSVYVRCGKR